MLNREGAPGVGVRPVYILGVKLFSKRKFRGGGGGSFLLKTVSTRVLTDSKLPRRGWVGQLEPRNS